MKKIKHINLTKLSGTFFTINALQFILIGIVIGMMLMDEGHHVNGLIYLAFSLIILNSLITGIGYYLIFRHKKDYLMESLKDLEGLNLKLREERHDYLNHLQVIYGLMEIGEFYPKTAKLTEKGLFYLKWGECQKNRQLSPPEAYYEYLKQILEGISVRPTDISIIDLHNIGFSYQIAKKGSLPSKGKLAKHSFYILKDKLYIHLSKGNCYFGDDAFNLVSTARNKADNVCVLLERKFKCVFLLDTGVIFRKPHFHCRGLNFRVGQHKFRFDNGILSVDSSGGVELDLLGLDTANVVSLLIKKIKEGK